MQTRNQAQPGLVESVSSSVALAHGSRQPLSQSPPESGCSFVFTSSKIGRFNLKIVDPPAILPRPLHRSPPPQSTSSSTDSCVLTPVQVMTHAYGSVHALPESSSFRRQQSDSRPSPIRTLSFFPDHPSRGPPLNSNPLLYNRRKSQVGISFYTDAVRGRFSGNSSPIWTPYSEPPMRSISMKASLSQSTVSDPSPVLPSVDESPAIRPQPASKEDKQESEGTDDECAIHDTDEVSSYFAFKPVGMPSIPMG